MQKYIHTSGGRSGSKAIVAKVVTDLTRFTRTAVTDAKMA